MRGSGVPNEPGSESVVRSGVKSVVKCVSLAILFEVCGYNEAYSIPWPAKVYAIRCVITEELRDPLASDVKNVRRVPNGVCLAVLHLFIFTQACHSL